MAEAILALLLTLPIGESIAAEARGADETSPRAVDNGADGNERHSVVTGIEELAPLGRAQPWSLARSSQPVRREAAA